MKHEKALKRLGYTQEWIDYGIISEDFLLDQLEEISCSEDQNAEHYRAGGFSVYLNSKAQLTNTEIENIFKLKDDGPDKNDLHSNRIIGIIYSEILTDEQLNHIRKYPEVTQAPIQKIYERSILLRKIKIKGVSLCLHEIQNTNDSAIHEYVLGQESITKEILIWLSEHGLNKRVKNIAKQLVNSKKYREKA